MKVDLRHPLVYGVLLGLTFFVGYALPNDEVAAAQPTIENAPINIAATAIPTGGITANLASPPPTTAVYGGKFTNSGASTVYCGLYASSPTLGTTALVGTQTAVPAGSTVPFYFTPTNGVVASFFASGVFAGCSTTWLGSTGVAAGTVGVEILYL